MTTPRRVLVTGGLGFLGAPLCRALLNAGHYVRALDDSSRGSVERLGDTRDQVDVIFGDVRDARAVQHAARGMDVVWHLAFINGTRHFYERPEAVLDVGVRGMLNVIDACLHHGVGELFLASSSEVYQTASIVPTDERVPLTVPDPLNPRYSYGGGKILSELMAINYGRTRFRRVVIFRPHNVYGPDMGWEHVVPQFVERLTTLRRDRGTQSGAVPFTIQGSGQQTRSFVHVRDFIGGLVTLFEKGEHLSIYNVGTEEELTITAIAEKIARILELAIEIVPGPLAAGGTLRRCPDTTKLRALGWSPVVSFDEGLLETVKWYEHHFRAE